MITTVRRRTAAIAAEAFVFAYPLVLMELTRARLTATAVAGALRAPVNQFAHMRQFALVPFAPVASPNVDTLYSSAWLDLAVEPMVLSVPDTHGRYYAMPIYDAWTNVFASPGARTTGTGPEDFVIVGPHWRGEVPPGLRTIQAPTNMVWIIGRTRTDGPDDFGSVHAVQSGYRLTPLSKWGVSYTPPLSPVDADVPGRSSPVSQIARMDAREFFGTAARLMAGNPPWPVDAPVVERMNQLGVVAGRAPEWSLAETSVIREITRGMADGLTQIEAEGKASHAVNRNNWLVQYDLGRYEHDHLHRAGLAWMGLGAIRPEDVLCLITHVDADGRPLTGARRYVLHFEAGATPPVRGFWSLTLSEHQQFFVDDPRTRYAIGDRNPLRVNADGSVDLHIQRENPGAAREANWLPTPAGGFSLVLRLYWPDQPALDGRWLPPPVTRCA